MVFEGVLPPLATPFTDDEEVHEVADRVPVNCVIIVIPARQAAAGSKALREIDVDALQIIPHRI